MNFYPRSPCGERPGRLPLQGVRQRFLSTLSLRRATIGAFHRRDSATFLSTLSLRRATLRILYAFFLVVISIHALLAESDCTSPPIMLSVKLFLSTLSLRRATSIVLVYPLLNNNFYPRSPCGERRYSAPALSMCAGYFYPRSPCGERPRLKALRIKARNISIHALLAESDAGASSKRYKSFDFYPRSPCGERLDGRAGVDHRPAISIHALLAESDGDSGGNTAADAFLSTLSLRRATITSCLSGFAALFLSTLSLRRATARGPEACFLPQFLSTLSLRRATRAGADERKHV